MRLAGLAAGSAMVTAMLLLGPGTAIAATGTGAPVASSVSSDGGSGGDACAQLPAGLQELFCPSPEGAAEQASGAAGGSAAGGASAPTGTTGAAPASGTPAPSPTTPPGVVSNFLIWLAGLFQAVGL